MFTGFVISDLDREGGIGGQLIALLRTQVARSTVDGAVTQVGAHVHTRLLRHRNDSYTRFGWLVGLLVGWLCVCCCVPW